MKLTDLFQKVAIKRLSKVETDPVISNQHELNGVKKLVEIFGIPTSKMTLPARFIYLSDTEEENIFDQLSEFTHSENGYVTWYDARHAHATRTEYRLYYSTRLFEKYASENDLMILGFDGQQVWIIIAEHQSTIENQVLWLFANNHHEDAKEYQITELPQRESYLRGVENLILEKFGFEIHDTQTDIEKLLARFQGVFPSTKEFSAFARNETSIITSVDDPDVVLLEWWNHEEKLFKALEKHIIEEQIKKGFQDVDEFASFANSVLNRRKSRAGHAFENHLDDHSIQYDRGKRTEGKSKPDFIFPSIETYQQARTDTTLIPSLMMLGAKTTCKDRWRQITKEANLIDTKHLITLEPAISADQTDEMKRASVQLVVPDVIRQTYMPIQQEWIMSLNDFLKQVVKHQS